VREAFFSSLGVVPRIKIRGRGGVVEVPFRDAGELEDFVRRLGR